MSKSGSGFLLGLLMLAPSLSASTVYTTRSSFLGALSSSTTIDLESIAAGSYDTPLGVSDSGLGFVGVTATGNLLSAQDNCITPANICLVGPIGTDATFGYLSITLPANTYAIGADFAGYQGWVGPYEVRLSTGETITGTFSGAFFAFDFVGITSTQAITSADFYIGFSGPPHDGLSQSSILDNVTFGTTVPEPSTYVMFGISTLLFATFYRLRRR